MAETNQSTADQNHNKTLIVKSNAQDNTVVPLWADPTTHRLLVDAGSITTSSASVGATGSAVPASADYNGINVAGNLRGQTGVNPSGSVFAAQNDLSSVGGSSIALGQQTAANSLPVILPSATITTLTPPTNTGYALDASLTTIDTDIKSNVTLHAGTNIVGKVTTDQTTHGTTDLVAADITKVGGSSIALGQTTMASSLPVAVASNQGAVALWGHGATAASVPANATYEGIRGSTALTTAVADGQLVGAFGDKYGRKVALISTIRDLVITQTTTISASTAETTIGTAVASTFLDLIMLIVSNTSTSTNTRIDFRDVSAGSVLFSLQSNGGQPPIGFALPTPIPQTSVNTSWTAQCATSTTDIRVYLVAAKNK